MSVEVQIRTVPHFKGLISGVEDVGQPLVLQYSYIMLFHLENSHTRGLVQFHSNWTVPLMKFSVRKCTAMMVQFS